MKKIISITFPCMLGVCIGTSAIYNDLKAESAARPNILVIVGDDISRTSMGVYGCKYIKTPNFDRIAKEGILFTNAYVTNPKCAPSRASLLTGRYSWQLEEACNHMPVMPPKWVFYPDLLEKDGYSIGFTGKGWAPGFYYGKHNPAGWEYNEIKCTPPYTGISNKDYVANFEAFLDKKKSDEPFCFWLGTHEAHRYYEKDSYKKENKDLNQVNVQKCFPDNDIIKGDLADYGLEVEYHDMQIGRCLKVLENRGMLDNTLIIATSDQGMPFPHIKGQIFDEDFHVAFAVRWGSKVKAGCIVDDFVNFPDVAPTIMEAAGIEPHEQMTGKSFLNILLSGKSGRIDKNRSFSLLGKERHDIGRTDGELISVGYPVRAIKTDQFLYVRIFKPNRWPCGNPEYGFLNCDGSPSKDYIVELKENSPDYKYFKMSFGKRPAEELYDVTIDPDCVINLAEKPDYKSIKKNLFARMVKELKNQKDPRIFGKGDIFDYYPVYGQDDNLKKLYGDKYYDMNDKFKEKFGFSPVPMPYENDSNKKTFKIIKNKSPE
ncbi:MAG: sulfatase [Bacteroidia bacterium]|nr:sulfatase [Bacteroidia bacterium]